MPELTRREFLGRAGRRALGIGGAAYTLAPLAKTVSNIISPTQETKRSIDDVVDGSHQEHHMSWQEKVIIAAGTANFAHGIYSLATKENLQFHNYPGVITLLGAYYTATNDLGKHHILKELNDGLDALRVIAGTTIMAEGVDMDLDKIINKRLQRTNSREHERRINDYVSRWEKRNEKSYGERSRENLPISTLEEKLFMLATLTPLTSSTTTTVGSSTIFRKEVDNLVKAVVEEYIERLPDNFTKVEKKRKGDILAKDLYADLVAHTSDDSGFMLLGDPPFIAMLQKYGTEGFYFQNKTMWAPVIYSSSRLLYKMSKRVKEAGVSTIEEIKKIIGSTDNWGLLQETLSESMFNFMKMGYNFFGVHDHRMIKQHENGIQFEPLAFEDKFGQLWDFVSQYGADWFRRPDEDGRVKHVMNMLDAANIKDRMHHNVGANMADVLSVFPFQAMSIPFLQESFKLYLSSIDNLHPEVKDMLFYMSIAGFSSLADNYVACKIGLDLYPDRPEIPLSAAIIGGSLLPPGNMANMTLVEMNKYSISDGFKRLHKQADMLGFGYAYAKAIPYLEQIPVVGSLYSKAGIMKAIKNAA